MPLGSDGFFCPTAAASLTLTADTDLTKYFAGQPFSQAYVRRIKNCSGLVTVSLVLSRVNDPYVTPPTVGGVLEVLQPGQYTDGCFTKISIAGSTSGAVLALEA